LCGERIETCLVHSQLLKYLPVPAPGSGCRIYGPSSECTLLSRALLSMRFLLPAGIAGPAREGDDIPDVLDAGAEEDEALKAEPKARVDASSVLA